MAGWFDPELQVRSCAHIDSPTAITPTVTSAIQVRSLLFSANQSAIDEYAALSSLISCPCMTRLLRLPEGHRPGRINPDQQIEIASKAAARSSVHEAVVLVEIAAVIMGEGMQAGIPFLSCLQLRRIDVDHLLHRRPPPRERRTIRVAMRR